MPNEDRVLGAVEAILDSFDDLPTSALVRRALRVATLLSDTAAIIWLRRESVEIPEADLKPDILSKQMADIIAREFPNTPKEQAFVVVMGDFQRYWDRRHFKSGSLTLKPIAEVEQHIETIETAAKQLSAQATAAGDTKALVTVLGSKNLIDEWHAVLSRTRHAIHEYLLAVEKRMVFSAAASDVFERTKARVDASLSIISKETLDQFSAAQERLAKGDPEALSHALLSCRRMLKSAADAVYPAQSGEVKGADGKLRKLTDDRYINRLLQYVNEQIGKHGSGEVVQTTLQNLGAHLSALDGLASKGVHADVTIAEVETCIIQTYLVIGEVTRLASAGLRT